MVRWERVHQPYPNPCNQPYWLVMSYGKEKWQQRTKEDYAHIFEAVRVVIHELDPYGLLSLGAPWDEFDSEIKAIVKQIDRIGSPLGAAHVIARVLGASFDHETFPVEVCLKAGEHLYRVLRERGILESLGNK